MTKRRTAYYLSSFAIISLALAVFLTPDRAYAGLAGFFDNMEPACKVLRTNDVAQGIWRTLLTVVNSLVVALMIAVAFISILRISVETYGIKKILPTLILAVIAANFSFLFMRLLVDIANVTITVFSVDEKGIEDMMKNHGFFEFAKFEWMSWFSNILQNLIVLAGAIMMYVLAFLFVIRNWVIYFLAIISPVAFMAMVLPQTKSLFNQWWQNTFRWVFMPVVSIALLWLASRLTPLLEDSSIMGAVIIGAVLYMAITMPFKLGGNIMGSWANVVKKPWAKTGGAIGNAAWASTKKTASNYGMGIWGRAKEKIREKSGYRLFSAGVRSQQFLDMQRSDEKKMDDRIKGQLYQKMAKNPKKASREIVRQKKFNNMEGEEQEFYKYMFDDFIDRGQKNPLDQDFVKWRQMWEGSGVAKTRMQAADLYEKKEENRAIAKAINGGYDARQPKEKQKAQQKEWQDRMKKNLGWSDADLKHFQEFYALAQKDNQIYTMIESKAEKDSLVQTSEESQRAHAVTELKELSSELQEVKKQLESTFGSQFKDIVERKINVKDSVWAKASGRTLQEVADAEKQQLTFSSRISRTEQLMKQENILKDRERLTADNLDQHATLASENYEEMKKIIQAEMVKNGGSVPLSLLNQVVVGTDGKIEKFVQLANVENTRLIGIIAEKTRGRTESYSSESAQAKADRIRHATDTQDKFTVQSGKNFQNGKIDSDDAIFEGQPIGWRGFVNRRNRMVASERAESAGLRVAAEQPVLVKSRIENADSRDINLIIDAWKDAKPALFETDSELAKALAAAGTDIGKQREALYRTFQGTPQNEKNRLVPAIDGLISKSI